VTSGIRGAAGKYRQPHPGILAPTIRGRTAGNSLQFAARLSRSITFLTKGIVPLRTSAVARPSRWRRGRTIGAALILLSVRGSYRHFQAVKLCL
jgi:hypothetical protein